MSTDQITPKPAETKPVVKANPKYILKPEQLAFEYNVLASAVAYESRNKLERLAGSLHLGSASLPYRPAGVVLKALLLMCRMTNQDGSFRPVSPNLFTPSNQRVTGRQEIRTYVNEKLNFPLTIAQLRRAMEGLKAEKLVFATHGRRHGGRHDDPRSVMFVKFNGAVLWQRLTQSERPADPDGIPKVVPVDHKEASEIDWTPAEADKTPTGEANLQVGKSDNLFTVGNGSGVHDVEQKSAAPSVPSSSSDVFPPPSIVEGVVADTSYFEEKTPIAERYDNPIPGTTDVEFELTPEQNRVIQFIETNPVLQDVNGVHNPVKLAAHQVKGIIRLMEKDKLTLHFLESYLGAINCIPDRYHVETPRDTWWLKVTPDFFIARFRVIRHHLKIAQAQYQLMMLQLVPGENSWDADVILRGLFDQIRSDVSCYLEGKTDKEVRIHYLSPNRREPRDPFPFFALLTIEAARLGLPSELYEEVRKFHLHAARIFALQHRPDALAVLHECGGSFLNPVTIFALTPAELEDAQKIYREFCAHQIARKINLERAASAGYPAAKKLPAPGEATGDTQPPEVTG